MKSIETINENQSKKCGIIKKSSHKISTINVSNGHDFGKTVDCSRGPNKTLMELENERER